MLRCRMVTGFSALLVLAAGLALAPAAAADSQARIVRLSLVEGPVQVDRAIGEGFDKAIMNMPITQGMSLSTQEDGRAEIEFEDGSTLRLAPGTQVTFPQLGLRTSGARVTTVQVKQGIAYFNIRGKGDNEFRLAFAGREIPLDRKIRFRLDLTGGNPELAVFRGELNVPGPSGEVRVKKNQTLTFDVNEPDRYQLAKEITPQPWDSWDKDRTDYTSQYASSSYARSPYGYGLTDLSFYGSWMSWPGYGMLWRPYGVGYAWDPFYNGAWAWYPSFGYTWVSSYPWGWTPYRYGSWVFLPGYGWAWRPGAWRTWSAIPPVYNAPPQFHRPRPPAPTTFIGGRPHYPTVVIDRGVIHNGLVPGSGPGKVERRIPPRLPLEPRNEPVYTVAPPPGSPIAVPMSPAPVRGPRPDVRKPTTDRPLPVQKAPRVDLDGGVPPAQVQRPVPPAARPAPPPAVRSAPPPAVRNAPPPRVQHSPPVVMEHKAPPEKIRR